MKNSFKKSKKNLIWGHFGSFLPKLDKNEFSWKKELCQFLDIPIIYHRAKISKKYWAISEENSKLTDRETDRQEKKLSV